MKKFLLYFLAAILVVNGSISTLAINKDIEKKKTNSISKIMLKNTAAPTESPKISTTPVIDTIPSGTSNSKALETKTKSTSAPEEKLKLTCQGAILMDIDNKEILYQKNIHTRFFPASTTKILTAIIAIESGKMNKSFTVGSKPPLVEPSKIYVKKGEKINVRQLVYGLMLKSGNDAALTLAEGIAGSESAFAKLMNKKAKSIGCKDSNFVTCNGLPNSKHYTSAYDLALITRYAMKNKEFRKIIGTRSYTMSKTNKSPARKLENHNKMIFPSSVYYYKYCIGGKTGYTNAAHHTHVSIATKNGRTLIAVVLKDNVVPYNDLKKLFEYGFSHKN